MIASQHTAIAFLTRLPVGSPELQPGGLSRAALWFPAVGALVGGIAALVRLGAGELVTPAPATLFALLAAVLVTGALHEDGLADVADAFGAHASAERRLEILRDPRVGTYGALAVGFALLLSFALLSPLNPERFAVAVLCAHVLGRCAPVVLSRLLAPARPDGAGALLRATTGTALVATGMSVVFAIVLAGPEVGAAAVTAAALAGTGVAFIANRSIGGVTGDVHGAAVKIVEVAVYAAVVSAYG